MSGGFVGGAPARVRIKGRTASVMRFCLIAVSFMMAWVLISSELGYYSRWFGPQILLELTIAFNVPAIPVLIISGQVEKILDRQLGPVKSMSIRLLFGLAGCTACAAAFPFLPTTHSSLLWLVAVLGMLSAIAFSTSYQLVQWFRHADIIALGIGGVGTGPLVLLLQLGLGVGPNPERWQWIAMFEVTALIMVLGLVSATSLFTQYWSVMTGEEEYHDPRQPLLSQPSGGEEHHEAVTRRLARNTTEHIVLPPDLTTYGVSAVLGAASASWPDEDDRGVPQLHRAGSASLVIDMGITGTARRGKYHTKHTIRPVPAAAAPRKEPDVPQDGTAQSLWHLSATPAGQQYGQGSAAWHGATSQQALDVQPLLKGPEANLQQSAFADAGAHAGVLRSTEEEVAGGAAGVGAGTGEEEEEEDVKASPPAMTLQEENMAVLKDAWQVLLAFGASVTIMYVMFPFFTYVQSSGLIGDELPKVLFFGRIFADLIGRFAPRSKALMVHSPNLLASFALFKVALCCVFFVYIKAPDHFHHDLLSLAFILVIWLLGGYINTSANIMAPALVQPAVVGRASALLALIFQVGHFAGLVIAVVLAYVLFGDVVG